MKLYIFIGLLLTTTYHQIGRGNTGTLSAKVFKTDHRNIINITATGIDCVDSLIIHTERWRIALRRPDFTDESVFEINSAETIVLKQDLVLKYELRANNQTYFYHAVDKSYLRNQLK